MRVFSAAWLLLVLSACTPTLAPPSGVWRSAAPPPAIPGGAQLVPLRDDRVLALAWPDQRVTSGSAAALVYDSATNAWTAAQPLPDARIDVGMVTLPSGDVLVVGGADVRGAPLRSTYLFDPQRGSWRRGPDMDVARAAPAVVVLADGRVLVLGGAAGSIQQNAQPGDIASGEILDRGLDAWSPVPALPMGGVTRPSAVVLHDDRVLVAGGISRGSTIAAAALYDPSRQTWSAVPDLPQPRSGGVFELTPSGEAVLMGGNAYAGSVSGGGFTLNPALDAELLDPRTLTWGLGSPPNSQRANNFLVSWSGVTGLGDGRALAIGFNPSDRAPLSVAYTYDPGIDFWQVTGRAPVFDELATPVLLRDGRVLVVGTQSAWMFDPRRSLPAPTPAGGWLDSSSTTVLLLALGALVALATLLRRVL